MYRFHITIGATTTQVTPLGFNSTHLVSEKERGQVFYRQKFGGQLTFIGDDYDLIWAVEQSDPCERITLLIEKYNGTAWVTYFDGYFSTSDGDFDLDRCTFVVTPLVDDEYDAWLTNGNRQFNILDTDFIATVVTTISGSVTYNRNKWLMDVIEALAEEINPSVNILSGFFTNEINPATLEANQLRYLTIAQKSDIKRPTSSDPATMAMTSFLEIMGILNVMFNVYWVVDGDDLRIEHYSYFSGSAGQDLRGERLSEATNKYSYAKEAIPKFERFNSMESFGRDFIGVPIRYESLCANQDPDSNTVESSVPVTTDIEFIQAEPDAISDRGFVLMANYQISGTYYVSFGFGILTDDVKRNMPLSWSHLHNNYFRHERALPQGFVNNSLITFFSSQKNKLQSLSAIVCDDFDPSQYITTPLTDIISEFGYVRRAEVSPSGRMRYELMYGPENLTPAPIPVTLVMWIRLTATHVTVELSSPSTSEIEFWMELDSTTCQQVIIPAGDIHYNAVLADSLPAAFNFTNIGLGTEVYLNDGDAIDLTIFCPSVPASPSVVVNSLATIDNGEEFDRVNVSFNYTNSGDAGFATIQWRIKDSGSSIVDSGDRDINFGTDTGNAVLTSIMYPEAGNNYTLEAKEETQAAWRVSNSFNTTPL